MTIEIAKPRPPRVGPIPAEGLYETLIVNMIEDEWVIKRNKQRGFRVQLEIMDGPYKGLRVTRRMTASITPRSFLGRLIRGTIGRELTNEELAPIHTLVDIRKILLGRPVLSVIENYYSFTERMVYYSVSFFARSKYYVEEINQENNIISQEDKIPPEVEEEEIKQAVGESPEK